MMMTMYETEAGSIVRLFAQRVTCHFNYFDEPDACADCKVNPCPEEGYLTWECDTCGGGSAEINPVLLRA